jgi:hypothetical protein
MKKLLFMLLPMVAMALIFNSCTKDDGGNDNGNGSGKLVKTVLTENDNGVSWLIEIEYDNQKRPIKVNMSSSSGSTDNRTISYGNNSVTVNLIGDDYVELFFELVLNNDGSLSKMTTDEVDGDDWTIYEYSNGYVSKEDDDWEDTEFTWFNGNLTKTVSIDENGDTETTILTYNDVEDKLNLDIGLYSPFYWGGEYTNKIKGTYSKNYPVSVTESSGASITYQYTFDSDGYPTKIVTTGRNGYGSRTETITYY